MFELGLLLLHVKALLFHDCFIIFIYQCSKKFDQKIFLRFVTQLSHHSILSASFDLSFHMSCKVKGTITGDLKRHINGSVKGDRKISVIDLTHRYDVYVPDWLVSGLHVRRSLASCILHDTCTIVTICLCDVITHWMVQIWNHLGQTAASQIALWQLKRTAMNSKHQPARTSSSVSFVVLHGNSII
jgi:hypothetical protein